MKLIEDLPLAGRKKTVEEEVKETMAILDIIYETSPKLRIQLIEALKNFPRYRDVIDVDAPLIQISIWPAGDGDGNENADIQALEQAVRQLKQRIKELYLNEIIKDDEHGRYLGAAKYMTQAINMRYAPAYYCRGKLILRDALDASSYPMVIADLLNAARIGSDEAEKLLDNIAEGSLGNAAARFNLGSLKIRV